jgi:hypothetical protein
MGRLDEILSEAEARLQVAKCGASMISRGEGEGKIGLRNVAVFGRMVTFATNNLKSVVEGFADWDALAKQRHFDNETCRYMNELRNVIEKQARTPTAVAVHLTAFNTDDLNRFERPPGAKSFVIGDQNGGTGWLIEGPDGTTTTYYVALPQEFGRVWLMLPEHDSRDAFKVASSYVDALEAYLDDLKRYVGGKK